MFGVKQAGVDMNRKMLAEMAVNDAAGFAAVAEVAWSLVENKSYDNFCIRLMDIEKHYDAFGLSYCKMIYDK